MFTFDVTSFVPRFVLNDKNGYAIAKAIEAGVQAMNDIIERGVKSIADSENMPEWRLDEMAWEYNIPYDYTASVEIKREWIARALSLSRLYGTPEGIVRYMGAYFEDARLEEAWEYSGDPFHFRMIFEGGWTLEKIAWATNAINTVKNLRSVLDKYHFVAEKKQTLRAGCAFYGADSGTYRVSHENVADLKYYVDENGDMLLDEDGMPLLAED